MSLSFVVDRGDPNISRPLRGDNQRARARRIRRLDQTGREMLNAGGAHLFGQTHDDAMRPVGDRCAVSQNQNIERHQRKGVEKPVLD